MRLQARVIILAVLLALLIIPAAASVSAAPPAQTCGPTVTHVVQPGQNLFRISLRYGTTMAAIAAANGITNYDRVYAGQTLRIPCAGSVPTPPVHPTYPTLPPYHPPVYWPPFHTPVVDCTNLRPTSPLDGMAFGENTFYWNGISGVDGYLVNVYNASFGQNRLVASFTTLAPATRLTGNVGEGAGFGFQFYWEVQALLDGKVVCSARAPVQFREAPPA